MTLTYYAFCEQLGAPLRNKAWSWSSISHDKRIALLSVWEDGIENGRYIFPTTPSTEERKTSPGRTELVAVLEDVIQKGYAVYGIECQAKDIYARRRSRKSFTSSELLDIRILNDGNDYVGQIVGRIPTEVILSRGVQAAWIASTAINDIDQDQIGSFDPEYQRRMAGSFVRDAKVRERVLKRARGLCEECNEPGFLKMDGNRYLETHHVISLSEQGADMPHNVIALCATDHRRAHYAENWAELQDRFLAKLSKYKTETES